MDDQGSSNKTKRLSRGKLIGIGLICAIAVLGLASATAVWVDQLSRSSGGLELGSKFTLTDHRGQPITEKAIKAGPALLFFGFTHCPEICPTTVVEIESWLEALGEDGQGVNAFFVTVDPERDTPEKLGSYLTYFSERVTGISGPNEQVLDLVRSWKVYFKKVPDPTGGGNYNMDHTASVYLLKPGAKFFGLISYGTDQDAAVAKVRALLDAS